MPNVATILTESAATYPEVLSIKLDDVELSFAALNGLSMKVAGLLAARGVAKGDRVAIISPNIPQMPAIYYGILRYGAIVVPLNPLLKSREVEYHLQNSEAKLAFAWEGVLGEVNAGAEAAGTEVIPVDAQFMALLSQVEPLVEVTEVAGDDTAVILYTSGTTGRPKGAELTHSNLLSNATVSRNLHDISYGDVIFGGLPFFHIFGQTCALNAAVMSGAAVTLLPRFDPLRALEIIELDKVTIFEGVPTMYIGLLRVPDRSRFDALTLRMAVSGGAALPLGVNRPGVSGDFLV